MSVEDKLRSFAGTRAHDVEVIRSGLTYGDAREAVAEIDRLRDEVGRLRGERDKWRATAERRLRRVEEFGARIEAARRAEIDV